MLLLKLKAVLKAPLSLSFGRSISQTSSATGTAKSGPDAAATASWPL
jgi:hypothetical protein